MASKAKTGSDDELGNLQAGHPATGAENSEAADGDLDNLDSRSMQAGKRQAAISKAAKLAIAPGARDPDRDPQGSIEAIDEGEIDERSSGDRFLAAGEAESRGNDDPTLARTDDVRDNPRGSPDKPGGRY